MNIAEQAFEELFNRPSERQLVIRYSKAFKAYNANVKYDGQTMNFKLSEDWKPVGDEIKIGLIQHLLLKVHRQKAKTLNMDLYDNFIRSIGDFTTGEAEDEVLLESFKRVNDKYFSGMMDLPHITWGQTSVSKLGNYAYGSNTITLSKVLKEDGELLDFVMYHEMLHKKHKYKSTGTRSHHHSKSFRIDERKFENSAIEDKLHRFLRSKKRKGFLSWLLE